MIEWVQIPAGLGVLIAAALGVLKYFGLIPEGMGGKVAIAVEIVVVAALTLLVDAWNVDLGGDVAQKLFAICEVLGNLVVVLMSSFTSHYLSKQIQVYSTPARSR